MLGMDPRLDAWQAMLCHSAILLAHIPSSAVETQPVLIMSATSADQDVGLHTKPLAYINH